jgi:hypothetical protein
VQPAHGEEFQFQKLGRDTLAEAQLGSAAIETAQTLGLKFLECLTLNQQPPGNRSDERSKATLSFAYERAKGRARFQNGARRKERAYQLTQSFVLLDGLGSGFFKVGQQSN